MEDYSRLQQAVREYYSRRHEADPAITFDQCMAGGASLSVRIVSRFAAGGIAAVMLVALVFIFQLDKQGRPSSDTDGLPATIADAATLNTSLFNELFTGFNGSKVLGLSENQSSSLSLLMEDYFDSAVPLLGDDLPRVKTDILSAAMGSPEVELDGMQARAMAGLMGKWEPRIENGAIVDYVWMDDTELSQYLAGCSAYCHQGTDPEILEQYLTDCMVNNYGRPCSVNDRIDRGDADVIRDLRRRELEDDAIGPRIRIPN